MRNLKKVLALVIAFSMMLSVVAFAGYADVDADADYASAVELTSALGIFQGDENGNFNADKTITRAEMAAVIIRMQGLDAAAKASAGATEFADVAADHWASGYINLASQNGIIKGTGDGNFAPNDTLTYEAAVAMIVRALGFEPIAERKGGWTAGYVAVANSYKVTAGAAATATRGNLAILVANAMNTPMMDQTSYGSDEKYEVLDGKGDRDYRTLLTDMDISVVNGVVGAKDGTTVTFTAQEASLDGEFPLGKNDAYKDYVLEIGESNIMDYQHQQVDAYVLNDGRNDVVIAVVASNVGETFELLSDDIVNYVDGNDVVEYYVDSANSNKTKEIKLNLNEKDEVEVTVEYNKGKGSVSDLAKILKDVDVELVFVENTGDSRYDGVIATKYTSGVVDNVDVNRERITVDGVGTINFKFDEEDVTTVLVDDKGNDITLEDIAEDDVVAVVADDATDSAPGKFDKYIKVVKLANSVVEGSVDETYDSNGVHYIVIDGQEYPKAASLTDKLEAGTEGKFYIGLTGKVILFDGSAVGEDYAYILEGAKAAGAFTNDQWQLKLLTKDGVETFDIRKNAHVNIEKYILANFSSEFAVEGASVVNKFIFDDTNKNLNKVNPARLVSYKLDGNGDIKALEPVYGYKVKIKDDETRTDFNAAEGIAFDKDEEDSNPQYRANTQRIAGKRLEDEVIIFNVDVDDAKAAYTTDISFLVDEASYTGLVAANEDAEYVVMVVADADSVFTSDTGFAVVTKKSTSKDAEGDPVTKITYVQNEEEGVLTFNDDSKYYADAAKKHNYENFKTGDVFMFIADAEGLVSEYIMIATLDQIDEKEKNSMDFVLTAEAKASDAEDKNGAYGAYTEFKTGYIFNEKYESSSKGQIIRIADGEYVVGSDTYKYTYNAAGRNTVIEVADFMADVDYYQQDKLDKNEDGELINEEYYASPVLLRLVDGEVVDVYTTTARFEKVAPKIEG